MTIYFTTLPPPRQGGPSTAHQQIDAFYAWVFARGVQRLAERGEVLPLWRPEPPKEREQ